MTRIGRPIRKIEAWPIENPIPKQIPKEEPKEPVPERPEPEKVEVAG